MEMENAQLQLEIGPGGIARGEMQDGLLVFGRGLSLWWLLCLGHIDSFFLACLLA